MSILDKNSKEETWYLDSGCSRHMTGNAAHLKNYRRHHGGTVTFGDGKKSAVIGKGTLCVEGLPELKNVYHVDGIKACLLSISQLCDENMYVNFTKDAM